MSAVRTAEKRGTSTLGKRSRPKAEHYDAGEVRLAKILARCMDAQRNGKSIEPVLARYPQEAIELRPLLEIAEMLRAQHEAANRSDKNQPAPP